ncbi:MAG TPA: OmpA family protein, partial [Polyangiaceae bacterium]|nr:OmpA family protein [Polyangiaceae bacterium]
VRNRRHLLSDHEGTREIWPAFTDVMSTMALILFVLVLLSFVRTLISGKRLDAFQRQIAASALQLQALRGEIQAGKAQLATSEAKLQEQQAVVAASDRQLDALRTQLQSIAVLRVGVLNKLKQAIEAQLGAADPSGAPRVTIGDNGDIVINESLVFEYNSYAIKSEGKPLLDSLARALGNVLADADVRANIDTILIQGHTDERGSASLNWDLSAKRATAVVDYLLQANKTLADSYGSYFAASAYSKFRPIDRGTTEGAYQQNRRIELSVIPKDENVRKVIDDYMRSAASPTPASSANP